jgi:signal transduction histidine kinase
MRPNAALCLALLAAVLAARPNPAASAWRTLCCALVLLVTSVTLSQDLFGFNVGIDTLSATSSGIVLLACALLLQRRRPGIAQSCAVLVALLATLALLGYLFDAPALYRIGPSTSVALLTAVALALLAIGVLASSATQGWISELADDTPGAAMGRRLLAITFVLLPVLGWLRLKGQRLGWYGTEFGLAIMVSVSLTVLAILIWTATRAANRADRRIVQLDRLYRTVSSIDKLIVRCRDRDELLLEAARIARDEGGFHMAFVSMAEASAPAEHDLPDVVLRAERPMIVNDLRHATTLGAWPAAALARGLRSIAALPVRAAGVVAGVFVFGSTQRGFFVGEEFALLSEISDDVGYALLQMQLDVRRQTAEAAIQDLNARLEEQVALRTAELQASIAELENFCYSVSHDLRAPLRTMDGYSQLVVEEYGAKLDDVGRHLLQMVRSGSKRMGRLVDDLLAFARLGRQAVALANLNMGAMVEEVWKELLREQPGRRLEFQVGRLPDAQADPVLLRQVWHNLLSNALKYSGTREVARIEVEGREDDHELTYRITDNGVGFDMQYVSKLFKVFQRLHSEVEFPGTGIGLAIVQRIVARHGGRVWTEAGIDAGASFWFSLPRRAP